MQQSLNVMSGLLRVNQVARALGCSETWLRSAEQRGRIPKARRDLNGWRYYTEQDIENLRAVLLGDQRHRPDQGANGQVGP